MFKFWNSGEPQQQQQPEARPQEVGPQSWYPSPAVNSATSSTPTGGSSSSGYGSQRPAISPTEAAGIIAILKDKSVDELRKLLSDKDSYYQFFLSLDQVKIQNNIRDELRKETLQLARDNVDKEPQLTELRNQCRIIRTTELAAAQEKLSELESQKDDLLKSRAPVSLIHRLQDAMNKAEEESESLHHQLLNNEMDLGPFIQKYKKVRTTYHRRALIHLAAKTSPII